MRTFFSVSSVALATEEGGGRAAAAAEIVSGLCLLKAYFTE